MIGNGTSHGKCDILAPRAFARIVPGRHPTGQRITRRKLSKKSPLSLTLTAPNMKLHLPKQLFTALLAAITLAAPAALTLGSTAWGADQTLTEDITWDATNTTTAGTSDTIFVGSGDGGTNKEIKLTIADGADITAHMLALRRGGDVQITGGTLTLNRLHIHNHNQYTGKELFELSGGVVTVNGGDDFTNSATGSRTAITIGHWGGGSGRLLVSGGTLNSLNGSIYMGYDSSAELEITGGTVNAKGLYYRTDVNKTSSVILNGGRLNIGTQGINNSRIEDKGNRTVTLTSGTLGVLDAAGWTLQNVDTTIGHITIDTNVWDAATGRTATGDAAGSANISLLGNLKAAEGGMNITLAGNGSITIDHTLHGTVTLAENAEARLYYDASDLNNYDKVLSGIGSTGASGFLQGYQIIGAGSSVAVYAVGSDTAVTLTNGAVMLDAATELYVRDELAYDGTTMGSATHYYIEEGGVFDFTGYSLGTEDDSTKDVALIGIMNKMSGAGTVKLASGAIIQTGGTRDNVNLSTNYKVAGGASASLTLTSWKHDGMSNWRTWLVGEGGSITVGDNGEGTLNILAGQRLSIEDGGQVSVGTLKLGHDQASDNPGSLVMSGSGSKLTVGGIVMQNGITDSVLNTVEITGGTLKVTGANAITYNADNVKTAVTLGGSDAASSVLLQTGTTTGWVMSKQANAASTFNVGYVTIDGTNTQSITFNGATLTGAITNNASLILGEDVVWNSGATVSNNGTLQINKGTGDLVLNNIVGVDAGTYRRAVVTNTAAGNLIIVNTGNKSLSGDIAISNGGKVTLKGGTFGTADAAITNNIAAENSTTLVLDGVVAYLNKTGDTDQILNINTELTNGSVMHMLADDRLNWGGSYTTTVGLNSLLDVGSTRQSLSGNALKLAGGTIYGTGGTYPTGNYTAGLDYHANGTITVTENSLIATAVASRDAADVVTLDVAADKTLTIGSYTAGDTTNTGSFVGTGKFDKTGNGTVLYKGSAFTNTLDIKAGVFEYYVEDERTHTGSITDSGTSSGDTTAYNGTFKKSGAGTLTLTNATVTRLNVAEGKLVYELADNAEAAVDKTLGSLVVSSGAAFEKTGAGTLNAGNLVDGTFSGGIVVNEGVLQFNGFAQGTTTEDYEVVPPRFVQLVQNLTTTGTGKVDITGRVSFNWTGTHAGVRGCTIGSNISVENDLQMNSHASNADADGDAMCRWEVVSGGTLEVGGKLWLTNKQKLVVDGGAVTAAGGVHLGHNENNGDYYSKIAMESGSLTTQNITLIGNNNAVQMTGGTITFTPAADGGEVLIDGDTSSSSAGAGTLDFAGGTLAATTNSWTLTGTEAMAVSLGNVEFDIAAGKTVTLAGDYNLTGTLSLTGHTVTENETTTTGTLALTGTMQIAALDTLKEGGSSYGGGTVSGNGFLEGNFYLVENLDAANIDTSGLTVKLGNSEVDASRVTLSETGKHLMLSSSGAGMFYVNSGTEAATEAISGKSGFVNYHVAQGATLSITPGDTLSATNAQNALLSTIGDGAISLNGNLTNLTIAAGSVSQATGKLAITGGATLIMDAGDGSTGGVQHKTHQYNLSSFTSVELDGGTIRYHGAATTLNNVTVTENGAHITFRDVNDVNNAMTLAGTTTLNGTLKLDTLSNDPDTSINAWKYGVDIARLTGSGTLDIHSTDYSGNSNETAKVSIQDLSGFTGAISLSKHIGPAQLNLNNLSGTLGLKTIDMDGGAQTTLSVNADTEATMATVISGNGTVTKQGAGKLTLSGASSYTGTTTVSAGELALAAGASLGSGAVTVASGATLSMGDTTGATETAHTISTLNAASGSVTLADKATLNLSSGTSSIGTLNSGIDSKINLAANATLNRLSNTTGTVTLTGSGVYDLGSSKALNLTLGSDWQGAVALSSVSMGNESFGVYGNTGSTIRLTNVTGYWLTGEKEFGVNLELVNGANGYAYGQNNGSNNDKRTIKGSVAGSGNWGRIDGTGTDQTWKFAGDVSKWTGKIFNNVSDASRDTTYIFTGEGTGAEAMDVQVEIRNENITAGGAYSGASSNGALHLELSNNNGFNVYKDIRVSDVKIGTGAVKLAGESNSINAGNVTISQQNATMSNVTVAGSTISATNTTDGAKGSISNANVALAQLQEDASFTIQDMTLTNTTVTAATVETKVNLQNVTASNVVLAKGKFSTDAPMSVVGAGGTAFSASTSAITEGSITINARAGASLAVDLGDLSCVTAMGPGKYDLSITLSGVGFDSYENLTAGSGIIFTADSWLGQLLTAQGATAYVSGAVETPASVSEGGSTGGVSVSYSAATGSNVGTVITITGLNVPEPASATLGLAALMMLCSRRRRKA